MTEKTLDKKLHVIFVYADSPTEWNCSQWRNLTPSDALNKTSETAGVTAKLVHVSGFLEFMNPAIQDLVIPADLIVFQRNMVDSSAYAAMEYFQGHGKPVLIDLDDAYHILPWSNPAHRFWLENDDGRAIYALEEGLRRSNGLIAPNRLLLSDWAHVAPGYYLPNFAERKWWENLKSREEMKAEKGLSDRIVLGWGGSVSHYDSWWGAGLREAAERVSRRHPEVTWMICGNDPRIYAQLPVSPMQKYNQPGVDPSEWPQIIKTFDIGLAPLFGPYDQRRSWIKALEYMLAGVPWIATRGEPYRDVEQFGVVLHNTVDNWEVAIEKMIEDLPNQQKIAAERIAMAEQWFADSQAPAFRDLFERIVRDAREKYGALPGVYYV